jgi:hypothetical protein
MQLVATPDTNLLLILTPLCSGTHYSISVSLVSVELVQFMSQLLILMFIQIFTREAVHVRRIVTNCLGPHTDSCWNIHLALVSRFKKNVKAMTAP